MASNSSSPALSASLATSGSDHHLEAYILRPHADAFKDSVVLSFIIEKLPLHHDAMEARVTVSGSDRSLLDSFAELPFDELRLVQDHTQCHGGSLLSVRSGTAVDMVILMVTLKLKSVIFVINIAENFAGRVEQVRYAGK
jgi:hypothetical protein